MADDMVTVRSDDLRAALNELGDGYTRPLQDSLDRLRAALPWKPSKADVALLVAVTGLHREHARAALVHLHELGYELRKVES